MAKVLKEALLCNTPGEKKLYQNIAAEVEARLSAGMSTSRAMVIGKRAVEDTVNYWVEDHDTEIKESLTESEDIDFGNSTGEFVDKLPMFQQATYDALPAASPATQDNIAQTCCDYFDESDYENVEDLSNLIYNRIEDIAMELSVEDRKDLIDAGYLDEDACYLEESENPLDDFDTKDPKDFPSSVFPFANVAIGMDCESFDGRKGTILAKGTIAELADTEEYLDEGFSGEEDAVKVQFDDVDEPATYPYGREYVFVRRLIAEM